MAIKEFWTASAEAARIVIKGEKEKNL